MWRKWRTSPAYPCFTNEVFKVSNLRRHRDNITKLFVGVYMPPLARARFLRDQELESDLTLQVWGLAVV